MGITAALYMLGCGYVSKKNKTIHILYGSWIVKYFFPIIIIMFRKNILKSLICQWFGISNGCMS